MISDKVDKVIEERFNSFLFRNKISLEESLKGSDFMFDCADLLHYRCYKMWKINAKREKSYIDSAVWIENNKVNVNIYDNKWLQ